MLVALGVAMTAWLSWFFPWAFLPYVFDRFRQADSSSSRQYGGLGLGLAIVRHIAELHGGRVAAHSEGLGKGATFVVWLPIHRSGDPSGDSAPHAARARVD